MLKYSFCCTSLPWQGLKAGTKKVKYERISEKKMSTMAKMALGTSLWRSRPTGRGRKA